jgi:hypothetical protein
LADLAVLSGDYFGVAEEEIKTLESVLTVVGGKIVYGAGEYTPLSPPRLPVLPEWSPVANVAGHWKSASVAAHRSAVHQCAGACGVHGHHHDLAHHSGVPISDFTGFWGAFGCSCFAF